MSKRSAFFLISGVTGCGLLLLCLAVAALAVYTYLVPQLSQLTANPVNRIVYVDNDSNIQLVDAQGEQRQALTTDASQSGQRFYMFPTWSPNNQHIAFVGVSGTEQTQEVSLYSASTNGNNRVTVFKSTTQIPFYLYWSPDSQRIGFLAQSDNEMSLMLGHADGKKDAQKLGTGAPFYWAWSPDSQSLLMHVGGSHHDSDTARLALLRWQESNAPKTLSHDPSDFEAPQYSPDGSMILYAGTTSSDQDALYVADGQDAKARVITKFYGRIAFAWSPDGKKIAWIVTDPDSSVPNFGAVFVSDADGNNSKAVTTEDAFAFYWSPDNQQIAYLTLASPDGSSCASNCGRVPGLGAPLRQNQALFLRWRVINVTGEKLRTFATFAPTQDFISVLPYFDQYARSMTFWSPDGKQFVYTQEEQNGDGNVWVADVASQTQPRKIGDGTIAVWSWK